MSQDQRISKSLSLETFLNNVLKNTDVSNQRSKAVSIEALQRYREYLGDILELLENHPAPDCSVTITVEGKTIRFKDIDDMNNFLDDARSQWREQ